MKKEELRIGNYYIRTDNSTGIVEALTTVCHALNSGSDRYETISGIPLTDAWLKTFETEQMGMNYFIHKGMLKMACMYELKYVHQLQNLYFALTGEELNVKKC